MYVQKSNYISHLLEQEVLHYPTLKTVLEVENVLISAEKALSREAIKRKLGGRVMHQTLNLILHYLEESGKILMTKKGVVWIFNPSSKLRSAIDRGVEH